MRTGSGKSVLGGTLCCRIPLRASGFRLQALATGFRLRFSFERDRLGYPDNFFFHTTRRKFFERKQLAILISPLIWQNLEPVGFAGKILRNKELRGSIGLEFALRIWFIPRL
jgi:hypothetical protein